MKFLIPLIALVAVACAHPGLGVASGNKDSILANIPIKVKLLNDGDCDSGKCGNGKGDCGNGKGDCGNGKGDCGNGKGDCGNGKGDCGNGKGPGGKGGNSGDKGGNDDDDGLVGKLLGDVKILSDNKNSKLANAPIGVEALNDYDC